MKWLTLLLIIFYSLFAAPFVGAVYNPTSVPNNKVGIHIISPTESESSPSASLVNSSGGDWGYLTILIQDNDLDQNKWQSFFNDLRRKHLIPIVRLATTIDPKGYWKTPTADEAQKWADFLDSLIWPTKNRYVVIYNEPNAGLEWGGSADPASYAQALDQTITALKNKSSDFFVMNAGFNASAPQKLPSYEDEATYLQQMNQAVPGIFNKLDGWASHSYPDIKSSPDASGRGSVRTYQWELSDLQSLGLNHNLPVFITETGWKHAEGVNYDSSLPTAETVAQYYQQAFSSVWNDPKVAAVTPFLLTYQAAPFDHFSFKKMTGEPQNVQILGAQYPDYYSPYQTLQSLPKTAGKPIQENIGQLTSGAIYTTIVANQEYTIPLTFKNIGQSIWNENGQVKLVALSGGEQLGITNLVIPQDQKIEPGQTYTFNLPLKAPQSGKYQVVLNLFQDNQPFDQPNLFYNTEVKSPVSLQINANLKWKTDSAGEYLLAVAGAINQDLGAILLNSAGQSASVEADKLLPDYTFDFTLSRPYYFPKTIRQTLHSGLNQLDFGVLQPDFSAALLHPIELWKLSPLSR